MPGSVARSSLFSSSVLENCQSLALRRLLLPHPLSPPSRIPIASGSDLSAPSTPGTFSSVVAFSLCLCASFRIFSLELSSDPPSFSPVSLMLLFLPLSSYISDTTGTFHMVTESLFYSFRFTSKTPVSPIYRLEQKNTVALKSSSAPARGSPVSLSALPVTSADGCSRGLVSLCAWSFLMVR